MRLRVVDNILRFYLKLLFKDSTNYCFTEWKIEMILKIVNSACVVYRLKEKKRIFGKQNWIEKLVCCGNWIESETMMQIE